MLPSALVKALYTAVNVPGPKRNALFRVIGAEWGLLEAQVIVVALRVEAMGARMHWNLSAMLLEMSGVNQ
jgi:hypothetical protein